MTDRKDGAQLTLAAECNGYERGWTEEIVQGNTNVTVILPNERRGAIEGTVRDKSTGKPIPGVRVCLGGVDTSLGEYDTDLVRLSKVKRNTDNRGTFKIKNVKAGRASLVLYHKDYGIVSKDGITVEPGTTAKEDILLESVGHLSVTVDLVGALDGQKTQRTLTCWPVDQGMRVHAITTALLEELEGGSPTGSPQPKEEGNVELPLAPGTYHVVLTVIPLPVVTDTLRLQIVSRHRTAEIVANRTTAMTLDAGGNGSVQGAVRKSECEGAIVYLAQRGSDISALADEVEPLLLGGNDENWKGYYPSKVGDLIKGYIENGTFYFQSVPSGSFTLVLVGKVNQSLEIMAQKDINISDGEHVVLELP